MKKYFQIWLTIITIIFTSCAEEEKKESPTDTVKVTIEENQNLDSLNKSEYIKLIKYNDAVSVQDTTIIYTYQLQELLSKTKKPIALPGLLRDITKKDSNYILKVNRGFSKYRYFGEIALTPEQFKNFSFKLNSKNSSKSGCFLFKPTSIKANSLLTIDSQANVESLEDYSSELTYDFGRTLLFIKGDLIDFYLDKITVVK